MNKYVVCYIKASDISNRDCRIPSEMIEASFAIQAPSREIAQAKAWDLFFKVNPSAVLEDYFSSVGSNSKE